jgi:hypothetical protein
MRVHLKKLTAVEDFQAVSGFYEALIVCPTLGGFSTVLVYWIVVSKVN